MITIEQTYGRLPQWRVTLSEIVLEDPTLVGCLFFLRKFVDREIAAVEEEIAKQQAMYDAQERLAIEDAALAACGVL